MVEVGEPETKSRSDSLSSIQEVSTADIELGSRLGSGHFNDIYRVQFLNTKYDSIFVKSGSRLARKHDNSSSPSHQFAIKRLHDKALQRDEKDLKMAELDLSVEAEILTSLPHHENIISLHAVSKGFFESPREGFLVLDCLAGTLPDRIRRWKIQQKQANANLTSFSKYNVLPSARKDRLEVIRIEQSSRLAHVALGVSRALEFLHLHGILYRDLKPDNVGFNEQGTVVLLDFGLARKIRMNSTLTGDTNNGISSNLAGGEDNKIRKKLTGMTGTLRYMAPEVARSEDYGFPADVHSFAVLLWELCTLEKPFSSTASTSTTFIKRVVEGKDRPPLHRNQIVSKSLRDLMEVCWHPEPSKRLTFSEIIRQLNVETKPRLAASFNKHCQARSKRFTFGQRIGRAFDPRVDETGHTSVSSSLLKDDSIRSEAFCTYRPHLSGPPSQISNINPIIEN